MTKQEATTTEHDPRDELARLRERIRAAIAFHRRRGYQPTDGYTAQVLKQILEGEN